jgi:hypothetical protein
MKLKDLKQKLNEFPEEMDDVEVLFYKSDGNYEGDEDLVDKIDIFTNTVVKTTDNKGYLFKYSFKKLGHWFSCNKQVTPESLGWTEEEIPAIIID